MPTIKFDFELKQYSYQCVLSLLVLLILVFISVLPYRFFQTLTYFDKIPILVWVVVLAFNLKSKVAFAMALISFGAVVLMLLLNNKEVGESVSVMAYNFLLLGGVVEIIDYARDKQK